MEHHFSPAVARDEAAVDEMPGMRWLGLCDLFLAVWLGVGGLAVGLAAAADPGKAGDGAGQLSFDIPAQSLISALDAYSAVTGREVFYDGALVVGRNSAAVIGAMTPDAALRALLGDADVVPRATGPHSFTLTRQPPAIAVPAPADATHGNDNRERYFSALQRDLKRAFCQDRQTRPGNYQLVIKLWMAPAGTIRRYEFLGAPQDGDRDRAFAAALRTVKIGEPSPADLPQPVTMVVLPQASGQIEECPTAALDREAD